MKFLILNSKFLKHYLKAKKKGINLFTKAVQRCPLEVRVQLRETEEIESGTEELLRQFL